MSKSKLEVVGNIKLQIKPGQANPSPPLGPALGQRGVNIMHFCNAFNAATESQKGEGVVTVLITVYKDKSYDFIVKKSPVSKLIANKINLKKGSSSPGKEIVSKISIEQIREIAKYKQDDLNSYDIEGAMNMVKGTALSMGLEIVGK